MEKFNVVLVALNEKALVSALQNLDFAKVNIIAIVIENGNGRILTLGDKRIPLISFAFIQNVLNLGNNFLWLIVGQISGVNDIYKTKKFLMESGVPENNIVNFELMITSEWIANLRYVEKYGADFFATGISYTEVGLDLNFIPHVKGRSVNLAGSNQDLRQGYLTAKYIFEHVSPGTIKFVLIGLAPYSFRYDNAKAFSVTTRHLQYMLAIDAPERNIHDQLLKDLVGDNVKNIFKNVTAKHADLNFDRTKNAMNRELPAQAVANWEAELKNLTKQLYPDTVAENFQILKEYIKLCLDNGAKPVGVVFPFAPIIKKNYSAELLTQFRSAVRRLQASYDFICVDLFNLDLDYDCFYNTAHLNLRGAAMASTLSSLQLYARNIILTENFCAMTYDYFNMLSNILPKDNYNALMTRVFKISAQRIRRKNKIKVGFVGYDASMWCGDKLYNLFARDERFETTIFLCLRSDKHNDELVQEDFIRGINQFQTRGLNVVGVSYEKANVPAQDVLIFLTPYFSVLPEAFNFQNLTAKTLMAYIPYAFNMTDYNIYDNPIYHIAWQLFFDTQFHLNLLEKNCRAGMPRGIYSGYSKLDVFFEDINKLQFKWKLIRSNAKKIIWAPHWSINDGVQYATFQWNYQFMYEFAKAHPETSWVVKPHPNLLFSAVDSGIFPSAEEFKKYLQAWDDLPNAQVCTGAYYYEIFATSDGLVHDGGSFIAEYQYVQKPMIYLTRDTQKFNDFGELLLSVAYLVDGRDLNAIVALMQRVFIDGDDYKAAERKEIFDKYLDYRKHNGILASEFIYKSIADELNR